MKSTLLTSLPKVLPPKTAFQGQLFRHLSEELLLSLLSARMVLPRLVMLNGVFRPEELEFLSKVFAQSITPYDSKGDRIDRALAAIALFRSGVTDEAMLVRMVSERLFTAEAAQDVSAAG